ncbi:hypothetical protein ACJQWK_09551 [Exserohilum turcicum]|uniref:Uncharacterized protein n=1 Tax=Exserohilum turcicum (strain 28A) TaxID=671987 RepID=R0IWG3_EXST2|nr:uncharacterized protein SETTUDRAFT_105298 [Exserohilum turcica Et28A]EOA89100.1 hypothetical protein SETTUDRAFT_105298 [Exserohilum turcica Et28A]
MVLLRFTTVATIISFHLSNPVSATPIREDVTTHASVHDIIPREYIEQVFNYHRNLAEAESHASWRRNKRTLSILQKRIVPRTCPRGSTWIFRDCMPDENERAWQDTCRDNVSLELFDVDGLCPEETVCDDYRPYLGRTDEHGNPEPEHDIICRPKVAPSQDTITTDPGTSRKSQYGYRFIELANMKSTDIAVPVYVEVENASVAAEFLGPGKQGVLYPSQTLTANLRGHKLNLCRQFQNNPIKAHNTRSCIPTDQTNHLYKGQTIDFTFAIRVVSTAYFFYSISAGSHK